MSEIEQKQKRTRSQRLAQKEGANCEFLQNFRIPKEVDQKMIDCVKFCIQSLSFD
jgi:hypothetical protein